ncbi:MAG: hypothetical protein V8S97_04785 [Oscillospiraceae bacterium]
MSILNPQVYLPGKPADNTSGYVETTLRSGSYNYRFDWLALTAMGFTMTEDLTKANVIVGSRALSDDALAAVKAGTPYMGYSTGAISGSALMQELGVEISSCDKGTDFLGRVVYPNNTLVNATYINEGDDVMYEYGTNWFTKIPEGATVLVQNAGKTPLQGCICLPDEGADRSVQPVQQRRGGLRVSERRPGHRSVRQRPEPQDSPDRRVHLHQQLHLLPQPH